MSDGDIVCAKLMFPYRKPYRILCKGKHDLPECAWVVMGAFKEDLKIKGDFPVVLAKEMGECLDKAIRKAGDSGSVDRAALSEEFDRLAGQRGGPHDLQDLVLIAAKGILHDISYGRQVNADSYPEAVLQRYMAEVYKSDFPQSIPLTAKHYAGVDSAVLVERIEAIQPDVFNAIKKWAKRASISESVANLRRPRRKRHRQETNQVDMHGDLR